MATRCFCQFLRTNDYSGISADEIMKGALASHQIQSDLSHATEQPTRLTECERRILTDEVVATRARATVETDSDEPDQRLRSRGTRSVVQSEGVVRSRKRAHGLDHITHVPAQATPGDPGIAVQPGNLKVVASMGQRVSGSRKRKRNPELDTGGYRVHNTNEGFLSKPSIDVEQLLETYGGLSERSAADWLSYPKKFFQMDDIPSALGKVNRRAIDRALCIFGVAGSSEHHSKMIQVVTAYTFQQEHGRKHINEPGLKQLRQRGSKFSTLVQMFEHKSILLLMPCTSLLRLDNEALEQMKSRMELSDDFGDLKHQLNKHEVLAQSLITFVKQVLLCHVPVREQTSSDGAMEVVVNETSLTQSQGMHLPSTNDLNTTDSQRYCATASEVSSEDCHSRLLKVLFLFKDHPISRTALFRATQSQKMWDKTGNASSLSIAEANFDEAWTSVFSNRSSLQSALENCIEEGSIIDHTPQAEEKSYSLSPYRQETLQKSNARETLVLPSAMLVAHIFPREEFLDRSYHQIRKLIMPYIHLVLLNVNLDGTMDMPNIARESLVELYLACCRTRSRQQVFMPVFCSMTLCQNLPDYLILAIAEVQSVAYRAQGRLEDSSKMIQRTIENTQCVSIRAHCQRGRLALSPVENALLRELYQEAESALSEWEVRSESPAQLELQVLRMKNTVVGRVSRYKGDLGHAAECLETCLQGVQTEVARYHVAHHLADVYCELKDPKAAERVLEKDINRLQGEGTTASKVTRRLFLPFAEALILQNRWEDAESKLTVLTQAFDQIACPDFSDQLGHVRSIIGLARIAHHNFDYRKTIERTEKALNLVDEYETFKDLTFYGGFLHRLQASACRRLRMNREAKESLEHAERYDQEPRHFMTGIGTYVLEWLKDSEGMDAQKTDAPADHHPPTGPDVLALP